MRSYDEYRQILELWDKGTNKKAIGRITGIPRPTVRDCIERYGSVEGLEKSANELQEILLLNNLKNVSEFTALHQTYAYLFGLYLGDGSIAKLRKVFWFRVTLDAEYPGIIQSCLQAVQTLLPNNKVALINHYYQDQLSCVDVSCTYKYWPDVFPQHGKGMKHTREIRLEDWQQTIVDAYPVEFFRGLFHSDGCRSRNIVNGKDYPRYQFSNESADILKIFCDTCDKLGLHWTLKTRRTSRIKDRPTDVYISKRKDVEYLDSVVGPKK